MKFSADEFLPPIQKFNDTVGPLFAALHDRFPLDDHHESGLQRSLGIFLNFAFRTAVDQLLKIKPEPLSREEWARSSSETKRVHLNWQSNLNYLRKRNTHYMRFLAPNILREPRHDDDSY